MVARACGGCLAVLVQPLGCVQVPDGVTQPHLVSSALAVPADHRHPISSSIPHTSLARLLNVQSEMTAMALAAAASRSLS
jgi:hypothetical protein